MFQFGFIKKLFFFITKLRRNETPKRKKITLRTCLFLLSWFMQNIQKKLLLFSSVQDTHWWQDDQKEKTTRNKQNPNKKKVQRKGKTFWLHASYTQNQLKSYYYHYYLYFTKEYGSDRSSKHLIYTKTPFRESID